MGGLVTEAAPPIPPLRQELQLLPAPAGPDGSPAWLIHDPLQNRFVRIGKPAFAMLALAPHCRDMATLIAVARVEHEQTLAPAEIEAFARFLAANRFSADPAGGWRALSAASAPRHGLATTLLHNYLFFRVPLVRPERFLRATLPLVRPLATRAAAIVFICLALVGLYLTGRQWDAFVHAASGLFNLNGALLIGATLLVVKTLHEFGHAYVATAHGCRVPVLGVGFMLGTPMLYADVTDAWRLTSRRARLAIDIAGVAVELALAAIATFLWPFLPAGPSQHIAFTVAIVGWVMSIGINLNPFMRFDGYHILADLLRVENLQSRAFALGRWRLREVLLGLGRAPPERFPPRLMRGLVAYAWATWIYRLVAFTGIALAVYHMAFKIAGIALFLFEIVYFLARPVTNELREWWRMRANLRLNRNVFLTLASCAALLAVILIPWSSRVAVPAVFEAADVRHVFAPAAGLITAIHVARGATVERGTPLVTLAAPELANDIRRTELKLALVVLRRARRTADEADREDSVVLAEEEAALTHRLDGLSRETDALVVRAPIAGIVAELAPSLHTGRTLGRREALALIRAPDALAAKGYIEETDLWRLAPGADGIFVAEQPERASLPIRLDRIDYASAGTLERIELASLYGGPITTRPGGLPETPAPLLAQYALIARIVLAKEALSPHPAALPRQAIRGTAHLAATPESLLARCWRQVLRVLVRESGA